MRKIMSLALIAVMLFCLSVISVNAAELTTDELTQQFGDYLFLNKIDGNNLVWEDLSNSSILTSITYSNKTRGAVRYYGSLSNSPTCHSLWEQPIENLSEYNYISFWFGKGSNYNSDTITITLKAENTIDDIGFVDVNIKTLAPNEEWHLLTFPISTNAKFKGIDFIMPGGHILISDIIASKKNPSDYYNSVSGVGDYVLDTFNTEVFTFNTLNGMSTAYRLESADSGSKPAIQRTTNARKFYAGKDNAKTYINNYSSVSGWQNVSKYNYISFWSRADKATNFDLILKTGSGDEDYAYKRKIVLGSDNTWRRYSLYIGGITANLTNIEFLVSVNAASVWIDDLMLSEKDPCKSDVYGYEMGIKNSSEVYIGNSAIPAGEYTVETKIINNTSTPLNNVQILVASYDNDTKILNNVNILPTKSIPMNDQFKPADYGISAPLTVSNDNSKIKMFVLDSLGNLKPYTSSLN